MQIAHTLGLVPVAEGVESEAQAEALTACGCDLAQGFHLGRPVDAAATRGPHHPLPRQGERPIKRSSHRVDSRMVGTPHSPPSFRTRLWTRVLDPTLLMLPIVVPVFWIARRLDLIASTSIWIVCCC